MAIVEIPKFEVRGFPSPRALDPDFPGHVEVHAVGFDSPPLMREVIEFMEYRGTKSNPVHPPNKEDALDQ